MNYISTRNKKLSFNFQNIFFRGLAPDGGLFLPKEIGKFDKKELSNLSKLKNFGFVVFVARFEYVYL